MHVLPSLAQCCPGGDRFLMHLVHACARSVHLRLSVPNISPSDAPLCCRLLGVIPGTLGEELLPRVILSPALHPNLGSPLWADTLVSILAQSYE